MQLIATKTFSYNTRRLNPGDMFEAKDPDGRLLVGVLKARKVEVNKREEISEPKREILNKIASTENNEKVEEPRIVGRLPEPKSELLNTIATNEEKTEVNTEEKTEVNTEEKTEVNTEASSNKEEDTPVKEAPKNQNLHTRGRKRK